MEDALAAQETITRYSFAVQKARDAAAASGARVVAPMGMKMSGTKATGSMPFLRESNSLQREEQALDDLAWERGFHWSHDPRQD